MHSATRSPTRSAIFPGGGNPCIRLCDGSAVDNRRASETVCPPSTIKEWSSGQRSDNRQVQFGLLLNPRKIARTFDQNSPICSAPTTSSSSSAARNAAPHDAMRLAAPLVLIIRKSSPRTSTTDTVALRPPGNFALTAAVRGDLGARSAEPPACRMKRTPRRRAAAPRRQWRRRQSRRRPQEWPSRPPRRACQSLRSRCR